MFYQYAVPTGLVHERVDACSTHISSLRDLPAAPTNGIRARSRMPQDAPYSIIFEFGNRVMDHLMILLLKNKTSEGLHIHIIPISLFFNSACVAYYPNATCDMKIAALVPSV